MGGKNALLVKTYMKHVFVQDCYFYLLEHPWCAAPLHELVPEQPSLRKPLHGSAVVPRLERHICVVIAAYVGSAQQRCANELMSVSTIIYGYVGSAQQ